MTSSNVGSLFSASYGSDLLDGRLQAIGDLRTLRAEQPRHLPLSSGRQAWGALSRRIVDRPTFNQMNTAGIAIREETDQSVSQRPKPSDLRRPDGRFVAEEVRKL